MKYIILKQQKDEGFEFHAIVFPEAIQHRQAVSYTNSVHSAGFFHVMGDRVFIVPGIGSESLKVGPAANDAAVIEADFAGMLKSPTPPEYPDTERSFA